MLLHMPGFQAAPRAQREASASPAGELVGPAATRPAFSGNSSAPPTVGNRPSRQIPLLDFVERPPTAVGELPGPEGALYACPARQGIPTAGWSSSGLPRPGGFAAGAPGGGEARPGRAARHRAVQHQYVDQGVQPGFFLQHGQRYWLEVHARFLARPGRRWRFAVFRLQRLARRCAGGRLRAVRHDGGQYQTTQNGQAHGEIFRFMARPSCGFSHGETAAARPHCHDAPYTPPFCIVTLISCSSHFTIAILLWLMNRNLVSPRLIAVTIQFGSAPVLASSSGCVDLVQQAERCRVELEIWQTPAQWPSAPSSPPESRWMVWFFCRAAGHLDAGVQDLLARHHQG